MLLGKTDEEKCPCRTEVLWGQLRQCSREALKTRSWPPKLVPVVFVFLLVNYLRKHLGFRDLSNFWGVCNFLHFESFLMGISMGPILILNIMAENDSNMIDLVLTHLTHPWGPPWTSATLGDPWRLLATIGDMPENGNFGHFHSCIIPVSFCLHSGVIS